MRATVPAQRLGLDAVLAQADDETGIGVKLGWDLSDDEPFIRTHVVVLTPTVGIVVLTSVTIDTRTRSEWAVILDNAGPEALLPLHDRLAGDQIKRAISESAIWVGSK